MTMPNVVGTLSDWSAWFAGVTAGRSMRDVASRADVDHTTVSRLLAGEREPSLRTAIHLARAFGCHLVIERDTAALTKRELEIMRSAARGITSLAIAATLHISEQTVKNHLTDVYRHLGARNRAAAVAILDDRIPGWRAAA